MRKTGLYIFLLLFSVCLMANNTILIPLTMSVFANMPQDGPTGSTPDPTDPNQFRASLTGNTLLIETQQNAVSYVVVQETRSDWQGVNYFYGLSFDTITCPITRSGEYTIRIGYWKTDFVGHLCVKKINIFDFSGHFWGTNLEKMNELPAGYYVLRVETTIGTTMTKFYKCL